MAASSRLSLVQIPDAMRGRSVDPRRFCRHEEVCLQLALQMASSIPSALLRLSKIDAIPRLIQLDATPDPLIAGASIPRALCRRVRYSAEDQISAEGRSGRPCCQHPRCLHWPMITACLLAASDLLAPKAGIVHAVATGASEDQKQRWLVTSTSIAQSSPQARPGLTPLCYFLAGLPLASCSRDKHPHEDHLSLNALHIHILPEL